MRKPSASTKPSRKSATSNLADVRQDLAAEQFELLHHRASVARAGIGQADINDANADLIPRLAELLNHPLRPAAEADRQDAPDIGRARLAADIALVLVDQRLRQIRRNRERCLRALAPPQCGVGLLVGLAEDHVAAVDDIVRPRLPAILGAALAVVA